MTKLTETIGPDILKFLSAFAQGQVPSLYIRQGPWACIAVYIAAVVLVPSLSIYISVWIAIELGWMIYFYNYMVPQLAAFRPEDSGVPHTEEDVDHIIDNIVFLLNRDAKLFWMRVTGNSSLTGTVPLSTARCFVKSLLFMFEDCDCFTHEHQISLVEKALARIEIASGGFSPEPAVVEQNNNKNTRHGHAIPHVPNHIRSWVDDDHLASIVRSTPLLMVLFNQFLRISTICIIMMFGFRRGQKHSLSGLECWVYEPNPTDIKANVNTASEPTTRLDGQQNSQKGEVLRPIVLLPGAGFGLISFLPLAIYFQWKFSDRTILLYRLPWVEVCRPYVRLPQWSIVMEGMLEGFAAMGIQNCEIDVISHSYGTAVANRLLRELCKLSEVSNSNNMTCQSKPPIINFLALLDPIVLGGATTGLSGFVINQVGPDLSFAFCGNRAGFSTKEILDYDPRTLNQCIGGIGVYMSENDMLVDVHLARHILEKHVVPLASRLSTADNSYVQFCVDPTDNSFHGRWLVEMWCMGVVWGAPCATRCLALLVQQLTIYDHKYSDVNEGLMKPFSHDLLCDSTNGEVCGNTI